MPRRPLNSSATTREPARRSRTRSASAISAPPVAPTPEVSYALPHLTPAELDEIRRTTNWRLLFAALGLQRDEHKSKPDDWWARSPFKPEERTASFHINDAGWFCFSTGHGGGVIELVQRLYPAMGPFDIGRWLLERGIATVSTVTRADVSVALTVPSCPPPPPPPTLPLPVLPPPSLPPPAPIYATADHSPSPEKSGENEPIRQDLRPSLDPNHPAFSERGIPVETLRELGAGFWQRKRPKKGDSPDPMNNRLVFQIRGLRHAPNGSLTSVILSHIGRAVTPEQEAQNGKWCFFHGFRKSFELYNIDLAVLDPEARKQAQSVGHVLVVEGCFDLAKLWSAGINNVVASFGSHLSREQIPRFQLLSSELGVRRFLVWYDRDQNGVPPNGLGALNAVSLLKGAGFEADAFSWEMTFQSSKRGALRIPSEITDPAEFSLEQVRWLRGRGVI